MNTNTEPHVDCYIGYREHDAHYFTNDFGRGCRCAGYTSPDFGTHETDGVGGYYL